MKKSLILITLIAIFSIISLNGYAINCTLNIPSGVNYDNGNSNLKFNVTANWQGAGQNVTNVTFTIGTTVYSNSSVNGTLTTDGKGDFTFTTASSVFSAGALTTYATCYNVTQADAVTNSQNSTSITYTVDRILPQDGISIPIIGSTVMPSYGIVTFEYTPTDANFGNCSLHLNNELVKQSSSSNTISNVSSGVLNRFTHGFSSSNNSIRVAINCIDLAGNGRADSNFTFNILSGATPYAIKQLQQGGGGGGITNVITQPIQSSAGKGFTITSPSISATYFQQWGWVYVIAIVAVLGLIIRKYWK